MSEATLSMIDVKKGFQQGSSCVEVIQGISVQFLQGKTYAITGVSGTGKSTLLHVLAGIEQPTSGTVIFNKRNIAQFSTAQKNTFLNKNLGLVFQLPYLIKELSVIENIMLPGLIAQKSPEVCKKQALELLQMINLEDKKDQLPSTLSGGQQQRVSIARAVFNKPTFLLADEPTGNLDIITGKKILNLLLSFQKEWYMGLIIITHAQYIAESLEKRYTLANGVLSLA